MKRLTLAFLFMILILPVQQALPQIAGYYPKGGPDIGPENVSLIQLIANPQLYDQKRIRFIGYLHLEFEGDAIYFHRDDFLYGITNDAVWINLPKDIKPDQLKAVNDHYVICSAKFVAGRHGHMGMFAGELDDVTRVEIWSSRGSGKVIPPPPVTSK
jgi:hypothetical protein